MAWLKDLGRKHWVQAALGVTAAEYIRLVGFTNTLTLEPADIYDRIRTNLPAIFAAWHGQHTLLPLFGRPEHRAKALISRHRDGEINAIAARRLGFDAIRGSGDHGGQFHRKGGVNAFRGMLQEMEAGHSITMTADVPKVSRVAGMGIVKLASLSGRPIYPVAIATSRRKVFDSWDKSVLNYPFGRMAGVIGEPIWVAADADAASLEAARKQVEDELNAATGRVYALVDGNAKSG